MKYNYSIEILKQEAIKLSGEIVTEQLLKKELAELGDSANFAYDLLFGKYKVSLVIRQMKICLR